MAKSSIEERSTLREIKRTHKSLEFKNTWFWAIYDAKAGLRLISEERSQKSMLLDVFKEGEYECHEIRSTGISVITGKPKTAKTAPIAYFRTCPIYEPFAIAGIAPDQNLSNADELPLTTVISAIDELMFADIMNKNIVFAL